MKIVNNSIYIHIPFCNSICSYCDFCKIIYDKKYAKKYINTLNNEINIKYNNEIVKTIYIGGGTPSSLDYDELELLLSILSNIKKDKNYEYTVEVNPENMDINKIKLFKKYGINRVSIGVQTFDDKILKILNRNHTKEQVLNLINSLNNLGIHNINIDMMFALPNQSIKSIENDLDIISKLNIKHISYYSLILEKHTKIYLSNFKEISEDLEYEMYNIICDRLKNLGYYHYEISNFSKFNYESKHNLTYWKNNNYYGFGLGACSHIDNNIYENTRSITKYLDGKYVYNKIKLSKEDIYINEIMLNLRLVNGINKLEFDKKYKKDIYLVYNLKEEIKKGRIIDDGTNIFINPKYIYVSNDIISNIMLEGVVSE